VKRYPYASPGWICAYTGGILAWCAMYQLGGLAVVVGTIAFGLLASTYAGKWMHRQ
jgi:hypothetical protein